ncbi:phosphotransferase [Streptomyces sp. NPDC055808]
MEWVDLPAGVRDAVLAEAGPVREVVPVEGGLTCWLAAGLTTVEGRRWFVKGCPESDEPAWMSMRSERLVYPMLGGVSPDFGWIVRRVAGWEVMAYDWVDGRHADLGPGSPDLPLVAEVLLRAQEITVPHYVPISTVGQMLRQYLDTAEADLLHGDTLLHTNTNPHNLLVGDSRAWMVDWAMAAKGPAWVDVAYTAVRLMEADTPADEALGWAAQFPSWRRADPAAVAAFVVGLCRQWEAQVGPVDCVPSNRRFGALLTAVRT